MRRLGLCARCALTAVVTAGLAGCGAEIKFPAMAAAAPLEGNWNLVGDGLNGSLPALSVALAIDGDAVYGQGFGFFSCTPSGGLIGKAGGTFALRGTVAPDGSFDLQIPSELQGPNIEGIEIRGQVPSAGMSGWQGSYSLVRPASSTYCGTTANGSFAATRMGPLTATYAGTLQQGNGLTGTANVTMKIVEGKTASIQRANGSEYYLSLGGDLEVGGISCFTHGAMLGNPNSQIGGYIATTSFTMNDGSEILLNGTFSHADESSLQFVSMSVVSGACTGAFTGTLQRQ